MTQVETAIMNPEEVLEFFGDKEMRWYQTAAVNQTIAAIEGGHKRILIELPTGTGKTLTVACLMNTPKLHRLLGVEDGNKLRVLFISHLRRLLTQAERTFADEAGVELIQQSAFSPISPDTIKAGWDIIVIDECQHEAIISIQRQLESIGDSVVIGLSATPLRSDGALIKFSVFVNPISREQAVEEGYLSPTNLYSIVDGAEKDKTVILKEIFLRYGHQMGGTMVFVRTKKEISILTEFLNELGYTAIGLINQSAKELDVILDEFAEKKYQFIISCNRIGEGVDVKGCSTVVLGRTLGSYTLLNQIIGRASRPDCECNVYELINPLSAYNMDTTAVVGIPQLHKLIYHANDSWYEEEFDYTSI